MPDTETQFALVVGNPFDGMDIIGPFADAEAAAEHGESLFDHWWVVRIDAPAPTSDLPDAVSI